MTFSPQPASFIRGPKSASPSNTRGGSRVPEWGLLGSVRGALSNERPYRDLRNVVAKYPFERSHRFAGIQPNSGFGDYSGLSAALGIRSSGVAEQTPALSATTPVSSRLQNGVDSVERLAPITDGPRAKAPRFRLPPFASAMAQTPGAVRVWKRASAREGRPLSDCWSGAGQY